MDGYWFIIPQSIIVAVVLFSLCFKRDMDAFKYVSLGSIVALIYTGIVLIVDVPKYWRAYYATASISPFYVDLNMF